MEISKFLQTELCDYASYDNIRKIASVVDGLKNSSRKVMHTVIEKNINKEVKVENLSNSTAQFTEYLHGPNNLNGVIVNLAQEFVGSNNLALLDPRGNFGTRLIKEASAPRYIYTRKKSYLDSIFRKEDRDILVDQIFEGSKIEPRYYLPVLPMLVINGSEGVSTGFAQKILPRDPEDVKLYIRNYLEGKETGELKPTFLGFGGTVTQEGPSKWRIDGKFERGKFGKVVITEIPLNYELKSYLQVLEKLEDEKVIKSFKDYSSESIHFEVNFEMKKIQNMTDEQIFKTLKLSKYETENYTCIDENNKIVQFETIDELMKYYIDFRLSQYVARKKKQIEKMNTDLDYMRSKYYFIQDVINDDIDIKGKKKDIEKQIAQNEKILKWEDSYDYLLRMQIFSLTKERCDQLTKDIREIKKSIKNLEAKKEKDIWLEEI